MDRSLRALQREYDQSPTVDNLYRLYMARARSGYGEDSEVIDQIVQAAARAFFADSWATAMEEQGGDLGPVDILDAAPPTPSDAIAFTKAYIAEVEENKKMPIVAFYEFVGQLPRSAGWNRPYDPDTFGHYLAMSAIGHGVGLWELVPSDLMHWVEVPDADHYDYDGSYARLEELSDDPDVQQQVIALIEGELDPENFDTVEAWIRQAYHRPAESSLIMAALDELLEAHGVESIEDDDGDIQASYVNMGDSYTTTVIYDGDFHIIDYATYVENM